MQVKALKTFTNKVHGVQPTGLVRTGIVLTVPDRIGTQWIRTGLAEKHSAFETEPIRPTPLGPDDNKNLGDAPEHKDDVHEDKDAEEKLDMGNEDEKEDDAEAPSETVRQTGGKALRSSALRQGRRSRKKT